MATTPDQKPKSALTTPGGIRALVTRAQGGDATALAELRQLFATAPEAADILGGDVAREAERALVAAAAGSDPRGQLCRPRRSGVGEADELDVGGSRQRRKVVALGDRTAPDDAEPKCRAAGAHGWHAGR